MHLRRDLKKVSAALAVGVLAAAPAGASAINDVYAFGDSLSDVGNAYTATFGFAPVSPPYAGGRFSNGAVWVEDLAERLDLGTVEPSLTGGDDYAFGGAQSGVTPVRSFDPRDLPTQTFAYGLTTPRPQPDALYTLWIGANDVNALATSILTGDTARADASADIDAAIGNVANAVNGLADSGMQQLLALNVPDLSKTPNALAAAADAENPEQVLGLYRQLSEAYNAGLETTLAARAETAGFDLDLVDTFSVIDQIVADPARFGFSNVTDPCWTGDFVFRGSGAVCSEPGEHLFWDGLHPSAKGHRLIADYAEAALASHPADPASAQSLSAPGGLGLGVFGAVLLIALRAARAARRGARRVQASA